MLLLGAGSAASGLMTAPAGAAPGDPPGSPGGTGSASPTAGPLAAATPIQVDLVSISPPTPDAADLAQPVVVTAILTNVGATTYSSVRVLLERGAPIVQRVLLHEAAATPPSTDQLSTAPLVLPAPLAPGASLTVVYPTTTEAMGLFLPGVYPYELVAEGRTGNGPYREAGRAATVVPSLIGVPSAPVSVSWIWPLIDVPHIAPADALQVENAVFDNDGLAGAVQSGGRLDRSLRVVEAVTPAVRMTLVIDPELIHELLVMESGYTVRIGGAKVGPGAGGDAAQAWLARLRAVASQHDLVLTGLADPDLNSIAAGGLPPSAPLSATMVERISGALGAPYRTDLVWPAGETLTQSAADAVLSSGATTSVLLRDTALSGGIHPDTSASPGGIVGEVRGVSDTALAPLVISGSTTSAGVGVVLDSSLRRRVVDATEASKVRAAGVRSATTGDAGAATSASRIQALVAELAMWPLAGAAGGGYVALAPDRAVDPDAAAAAAAILATAATGWTAVIPVRDAVLKVARVERGGLASGAPDRSLDPALVSAVREAQSKLSAAAQLLGPASDALDPARAALVLATSVAWRSDAASGLAYAAAATATAQAIVGGVSVVTPDNASYSLSSENSPLIITVRNDLDFAVSVKLLVVPATASVSGFRADDIGVQVIEANTARTLQIPAHFERSGRFEIVAQLATETGASLGEPIRLSVLCTAYGTVALTITVAAFALLLLLLLFRAVRGLRRAHRARSADRSPDMSEPRP
ncbi:MAG: glycoprotein [Jatrophihabitantaceae bacterium]|nr:glycoprotein [Jatrophihabitantaceae bacterium]